MIKSLLIANRGEIAVRIIRTCREMGIRSVAVYSTADQDSLPVRMADQAVCIGPPPSKASYLNVSNLISAALLTGCDAIHPGVGFLAENAEFARKVIAAGLVFIGPSPEVIDLLGDKIQAKQSAQKNGVPVIPGLEGSVGDVATAVAEATKIGFPVIVKAAAGGGGKGIRIVRKAEELPETLKISAHEAETAFSDGRLYIEKYLENPRHVELQILADSKGNVIHLGERDCSVQQNHQKLVEESPSPIVTPEIRKRMGDDAVRLFKNLGYVGAGTIEFLFQDGKYYFMEVNARVQVEHTVTEMITAIDIIREQILTCSGSELEYKQKDVRLEGYVVECRINAKAPGTVTRLHLPGGFGVRIDTFLDTGCQVPPFYDSLIVKALAWGRNRKEGLDRMLRLLDEFVLEGVPTNIDVQKKIIANAKFRKGDFGTSLFEEIRKEMK